MPKEDRADGVVYRQAYNLREAFKLLHIGESRGHKLIKQGLCVWARHRRGSPSARSTAFSSKASAPPPIPNLRTPPRRRWRREPAADTRRPQ